MREIVPTTDEHVFEMANNMREADKAEVWAAHHHTPLAAITRSVQMSSEPFTGLADGRVVCIFGVGEQSLISDEGSPWLLGTDLIEANARLFLRLNRVYVDEIKKRYSLLENYVDCRNVESIRWLKWLGFKFDEPAPYGPDNLPFMRFEYRRQ